MEINNTCSCENQDNIMIQEATVQSFNLQLTDSKRSAPPPQEVLIRLTRPTYYSSDICGYIISDFVS